MNKSCAAKHWWSQVCSKALARGATRSVFVITSGQPTALKFTMRGEAPRSLSVSVADMGPEGVGDALVSDRDVLPLSVKRQRPLQRARGFVGRRLNHTTESWF